MDTLRELQKVPFAAMPLMCAEIPRYRTIWLVYLLDTQSSIETSSVSLVCPRDVRHLPLPASNTFWNAPSAITWGLLTAHSTFAVFTLDDAMQKIFDFSAELENLNGGFGIAHSSNVIDSSAEVTPSVLDVLTIGPFARLMMIITMLRGLIEYGEGNHGGGYVVQRWITGGQNGHLAYNGDDPELFHHSVMNAFNKALVRVGTATCLRDDFGVADVHFSCATSGRMVGSLTRFARRMIPRRRLTLKVHQPLRTEDQLDSSTRMQCHFGGHVSC